MPSFKRVSIFIFILIILCGVALGGLVYFQPRIPLGVLSGPLSQILTIVTGQPQSISGRIYLTPGKWTTLEIMDTDLACISLSGQRLGASIGQAMLRINLFSLLNNDIRIDGFKLTGIDSELHLSKMPERQDQATSAGNASLLLFPQSIDISGIEVDDLNLNLVDEAGESRTVQIATAAGNISTGSPSKLDISTTYMGQQLEGKFLLDTSKEDQEGKLRNAFSVAVSHRSSHVSVTGSLVDLSGQPYISGAYRIEGENFDDISRLIGSRGSTGIDFALGGSFILTKTGLEAQITELSPLADNLHVDFTANGFDLTQDRFSLAVKSSLVNLDLLKVLISDPAAMSDSKQEHSGTRINSDDIVLPTSLPIKNLSVDASVSTLVAGGSQSEGVQCSFKIDDGQIDQGDFHASLAGHFLSGNYTFVIDQGVPELSARLTMPFLDLAGLLEEMEFGSAETDFSVSDISIVMATRGAAPGDVYDNLTISLEAGSGMLYYKDLNTRAKLPIVIESTHVKATPEEKLHLDFVGTIDSTPLSFTMDIDNLRRRDKQQNDKAALTATIESVDTELKLSGTVPLPFKLEGIALNSTMTGESFSSLGELIKVRVPDIGPYELSGKFSITPFGYLLDAIAMTIGDTQLGGDISVDTRAAPPLLLVNLDSPHIQLDDIRTIWEGRGTDETSRSGNENTPFLTDQEVLDTYDATIRLHVNEVVSGDDLIGSGLLVMNQKQGTLHISPLQMELPYGRIDFDLFMEPSGQNRHYLVKLAIDDFDYGIFGRYLEQDSNMKGTIDLQVHLDSIAPDNHEIIENSSGSLSVLIKPELMQAGVIDLWAVNIIDYLLPVMNPDNTSKINCLAGNFDITDGILTQKGLLIDTSRIQVTGKVDVDFHKRWINAYLRPIPKRPQFYSLATPITIDGSLDDFHVGISAGAVLGTLIRLATSFIVVPLQWVIRDRVPENGISHCVNLVNE